jgi:hypothetical protein
VFSPLYPFLFTVPASSRGSSCCSSLSAAAADFTSLCYLLMGASKPGITYKFGLQVNRDRY